MNNTVFILGAGASREGGGPLMSDFLDIAEDMLTTMRQNEQPDPAQASFDLVFKGIHKLQEAYARSTLDLNNIESVFAAFEMATLLGRLGDFTPEEIQQLEPAMRRLIVRTLEMRIRLRLDTPGFTPAPYGEFAKFILDMVHRANITVTIITFNYDVALDYAFSRYPTLQSINYGLPSQAAGVGQGQVPVMKLHGSLNWATCACGMIVPWQLPEYFQTHPEQNPVGQWPKDSKLSSICLEVGSRISELVHCDKPVSSEPLIVPPVWNKTHYHHTLAAVWSRAAHYLSEAQNIFVIGYSLPESDQFFRYLYALGTVGSTRLRRFWVFDPDPTGRVQSNFKSLLGGMAKNRFCFEPQTFREAIFQLQDALLIPRFNLREQL